MDIRIVRGRQQRVWLWTGVLVAVLLVAWASAWVFGDATERGERQRVGAAANFGAERGEVVPMQTENFEAIAPLQDRELGRLVRLTGTAESAVRRNAVWVRTPRGKRILVRFEPEPPAGALRATYPGAAIDVDGYLGKISRTELDVWLDSLNVVLPRPKPGIKFGDLPDSNFARVDSLFVKDYYISVRPEGIRSRGSGTGLPPAPAAPRTPPPAAPAPPPAAAVTETPAAEPEEIVVPEEPGPREGAEPEPERPAEPAPERPRERARERTPTRPTPPDTIRLTP